MEYDERTCFKHYHYSYPVRCGVCWSKTQDLVDHPHAYTCKHPDCKEYDKWLKKTIVKNEWHKLPCLECFGIFWDVHNVDDEDFTITATKKIVTRRPTKSARSQKRQAAMLSMVTFV